MISLATFCKRKASRCTLPGTLEIRIVYNNEYEKKRMEKNKKKKKRVEKNVNTLNICRSKVFLFLFFLRVSC